MNRCWRYFSVEFGYTAQNEKTDERVMKKKEQRTEVNYLEQIVDSKCNMSTCRKLKGFVMVSMNNATLTAILHMLFLYLTLFQQKLYSMWMIEKQDVTHFLRHWILNSKAQHPFIHILQHVQTSTNRISKGCIWPRKHKR